MPGTGLLKHTGEPRASPPQKTTDARLPAADTGAEKRKDWTKEMEPEPVIAATGQAAASWNKVFLSLGGSPDHGGLCRDERLVL